MTHPSPSTGPLAGLRIVEFAGIGPGPFCGMLLADMGAEVIVIERAGTALSVGAGGMLNRGKRSIALNLKLPADLEAAQRLLDRADGLIEGYRPGVMERLGLGPEPTLARNPRLVYGRVTGWGQSGPLAQAAGHDINYVALTGVLSLSARAGAAPTIPATMIGDMAGGALFLAFGLVCALHEARSSGRGQVIDAAMVDGVNTMATLIHSLRAQNFWRDAPEQNFFLHSSPFYDSFECADGKHLSLGAIEPQFYAELLRRLGFDDVDASRQYQVRDWPELRARVAERLLTRTRDAWCGVLEGTDACVAPVLSLAEAPEHPHNRARGNFVEVDGVLQPAPSPRFSRTPARAPQSPPEPGAHTQDILQELGLLRSDLPS
ncbi:CaiB/BaiF CoA transferase family protein [Roseateles toxinivorans]|uniref:Alpha-methylacyl-CoA racemase n=1 Tax=Roseateles toxinivorans TaxID=270368 RepID=A0A4R6QNN8_9BURK|nr:CaiB/BaiF CoA-transferase family protein [Roseateles toxinivorans]TDP71770.1 alpha-methylacyl-CoA racemase [Roseateles toxinivorans]